MSDSIDLVEELHLVFINSMYEVEALDEFYKRCTKNYGEYSSESIKEILYGVKLYAHFVYIVSGGTVEECNKRIDDVNLEKIDHKHLVKDICSIEKFKEGDQLSGVRYTLNENFKNKRKYLPNLARKSILEISSYQRIVAESFLSNVIVVFESFLSAVYNIIIRNNPLKYLAEKKIDFHDLVNLGHESCINEIIAKEIDDSMYNSLQLLTDIGRKESIHIEKKLFEEFSEIYFRRNIYVHNKGCVNSSYLKSVARELIGSEKNGEYLHCDDKYCKKAIEVVSDIIFSVVFELAKNANAKEEDLNFFPDYYFERLKNKDYSVSKNAYKVLRRYNGFSFAAKLAYNINYINAMKQLGEIDEVKRETDLLDVSATSDTYRIAKECLLGNDENVYKMLCESYPDSFDAVAIKEWPIFINFRETDYYQMLIKKYKDDFSVDEVEIINPQIDFDMSISNSNG